jgi:hypothetical protein
MFGTKKPAPTFPAGELNDRLSQLIAAASAAGLGSTAIAETLEAKAQTLRVNAAMCWIHDSVPRTVPPKVSTVEALRDALLLRRAGPRCCRSRSFAPE